MINILGEINGLIQIYQEFLNFKDDQDLSNLIQKLPNRPTTTTTTTTTTKLLTDLSIDFNKPPNHFIYF